MRPIDIGPANLETIRRILCEHTPGLEVRVFGSRVSWTARATSDLDLALMTDEPLTVARVADLRAAFTESDLPFRVDIVDWASTSETFRKVIEKDHVVLVGRKGGKRSGRPIQCLGDVADIVMGQSPLGDTVSDCRGLPLLNGPTEFGTHHPLPVQFSTDPRKYSQNGDILFCVRGSTTGRMNWADQRYAIGRGIAAIRHRHEIALQPFIRAVIEFALPELLAHATGSTFPNVSAHQLAEIPCPDFDKGEQRAIAHILGTLDDKIELNRRMNATLEAMARALFTSWFVDFDPVRAKMEGRDTGLPKGIADLFPDRLVESELGEIPEGWEVQLLGEVVEIVKGRSYKSAELVASDTALVTLKSFERGGGYRRDGLKSFIGNYKEEQVIQPGEVVIASTDVTQKAEVIGRTAIVRSARNYQTLVASLDTLIVRPKDSRMTQAYLYFLGTTWSFVSHTHAHTTGTTVLHLAKNAIPSFTFASPPRELVRCFNVVADQPLARVQVLEEESETLAALRDTLLPKLVSGELRMNVGEPTLSAGERSPRRKSEELAG